MSIAGVLSTNRSAQCGSRLRTIRARLGATLPASTARSTFALASRDRVDDPSRGDAGVGGHRGDGATVVDGPPQLVGRDADRGCGDIELVAGQPLQHLTRTSGCRAAAPPALVDARMRLCIASSIAIAGRP